MHFENILEVFILFNSTVEVLSSSFNMGFFYIYNFTSIQQNSIVFLKTVLFQNNSMIDDISGLKL